MVKEKKKYNFQLHAVRCVYCLFALEYGIYIVNNERRGYRYAKWHRNAFLYTP
jgi:hypothetical protein